MTTTGSAAGAPRPGPPPPRPDEAWRYDQGIYRDRGCDLARLDARCARCCTCPLPACRYDLQPGQGRALLLLLQLDELLRGRPDVDRGEAARRLGVSTRTLDRMLQKFHRGAAHAQ